MYLCSFLAVKTVFCMNLVSTSHEKHFGFHETRREEPEFLKKKCPYTLSAETFQHIMCKAAFAPGGH